VQVVVVVVSSGALAGKGVASDERGGSKIISLRAHVVRSVLLLYGGVGACNSFE
jgi:hypothetical protein